ncbi:MAG TPA: DNA polymerase III subunit delta [Gammaproteobacteria bacterium]|jgi:DNA polymerase-3 subunit delta|nr:DNA polymerase III subunit delta [Gammaproteobacteria bacterium]
MKIAYPQLNAHLTKELQNFYWICSDEILLSEEAAAMIRKSAQTQGYTESVTTTFESNTDFEKIMYTDTHSLSLFETKKIVELNFHSITFKGAHGKILAAYLQQPAKDVLLIVRTQKLDATMEKSQWYKTIEKLATVIPIWPIPAEQLPSWISERAKKHSLQMTPDAARALSFLVEGNLLAAAQEIEKLGLLATHGTIDQAFIENIATDNAQFDIFQLVDTVCHGNKTRALHILKNLNDNTEPTLVLWALTRELRTLATIFAQLQKGETLPTLFGKLRVFGKRKTAIQAFMQRHSLQNCWDFLLTCASIDRMIKGVDLGNAWDALEDLVWNM